MLQPGVSCQQLPQLTLCAHLYRFLLQALPFPKADSVQGRMPRTLAQIGDQSPKMNKDETYDLGGVNFGWKMILTSTVSGHYP